MSTARTSPATVIGPLVASVVVLLIALPVAWMLAYFMNDDIETTDHVVFLAVPTVELTVTALVAGLIIARNTGIGYARALGGSAALVAVPPLAATVVYALLSLTPLLDDAIGASASNVVWTVVAVLAAALLVALAWAGPRLVRPAARP